MAEDMWRPLGVDSEDEIAEYDALHDGVPVWMDSQFWEWVRESIVERKQYGAYPDRQIAYMVDCDLCEYMCQSLKIPLPNLRQKRITSARGEEQQVGAMYVLKNHDSPLQVADYLLAHGGHADPDILDGLLTRSNSVWKVGERSGKTGLVRRVPLGVQVALDDVMSRSGRSGTRLAAAWEALYGLEPDPSAAYGLAIKAVEDAVIPVVSPSNQRATLGTVLKQMEQQSDWRLPMDREHDNAPSKEVLIGLVRLIWHGQHDRHGGQPSAPGNVNQDEAVVAVSAAVTLVNWFSSGLVTQCKE